ncbi:MULTISPECIES: LlaJI family restriction endonuclease [unclassified Desulfovibrio]|uniref:LlaJI family restriction endonuclease n=1 Tax=unclassified Desulfovibrio TaxID=2593640 RepID=UPI0013EBE4F9|nr:MULTISPECIES: LlaJI family restriction endonuclease [unclassified Desulfovibrio]
MKVSGYFAREGEECTTAELFKKFCLSNETGEQFLSLLLQYGVLAPQKRNSGERVFKFSFVGIVVFKDLILRCYPKYIRSTATPHKAFAQVMKVLRCHARQSKVEFAPGGENEPMGFSLIAEALALLDDYAEHGLYSHPVADAEYNGTGEILWDKTLGAVDPFFCEDIPLYLDFHTKRTVDDTSDYVTRLHKFILTECSRLLEDADLLSMFGLSPLRLSDEPSEHFGPEEYVLQRLRAELDIQFESHKQELLRRLLRYIERRESLTAEPLHLYGTTSFETVWEKVCARAFGNQLNVLLEKLPLRAPLHAACRGETTLISLIKRPEWHLASGDFSGNGTLIPDIAVLYRHNGETVFLILDAKYYTYATLRDNHPGIGDIDKQYLYEVAFRPFLETHGIHRVENIFLLPGEGGKLEYKGYVEFALLKNLGCEAIKIVLVPAEQVFAAYLKDAAKENLAQSLLCEVEQNHLIPH